MPTAFVRFFLFLMCYFLFLVCPSFAETTIKVLLLDTAYSAIPQKDEKIERIGKTNGELLLEGLKHSGSIEVWKGERGLYIITEIPLEEYTSGVVSAEVGRSWDAEALKAQAVVSRTYALYQKLHAKTPKNLYHLTSSVLSQVYRGGPVPDSVQKAVRETRGEILTYGGEPIIAYYHSTSCGMTEDPSEVFGKSYPYLKPVETNCELSPYFMWERRIPVQDIERAVGVSNIKEIVIGTYTVTHRVKSLSIATETGEHSVLAKDFRKSVGWDRLPSTVITDITRDGDSFVFEGKGYGHGVGMCQWAALSMAKAGMKYKEILSTFYPGTTIEVYENR